MKIATLSVVCFDYVVIVSLKRINVNFNDIISLIGVEKLFSPSFYTFAFIKSQHNFSVSPDSSKNVIDFFFFFLPKGWEQGFVEYNCRMLRIYIKFVLGI